MGHDLNSFGHYHRAKVHKVEDHNILKRDKEDLVKRGLQKIMVSRK